MERNIKKIKHKAKHKAKQRMDQETVYEGLGKGRAKFAKPAGHRFYKKLIFQGERKAAAAHPRDFKLYRERKREDKEELDRRLERWEKRRLRKSSYDPSYMLWGVKLPRPHDAKTFKLRVGRRKIAHNKQGAKRLLRIIHLWKKHLKHMKLPCDILRHEGKLLEY